MHKNAFSAMIFLLNMAQAPNSSPQGGREVDGRTQIAFFNILLIQQFLNTSQMNFYTLLTNGYANAPRTPPPLPSAPRTNIPLILTTIGQALKISIRNYGTILEQTTLPKKTPPPTEDPEEREKRPKQEASKRREGKEEKAQIQKIIEKENISERLNHQSENNCQPKQNPPQNLTNDQPSHSPAEAGQPTNKKQDCEPKGKQDKIRNKKDIRSVGIPEISLILAAQLPLGAFSSLQLRKKKESLLRRRVDGWHYEPKNRRDKREIRMLNS